jgi:hypothetical protein
VAYQALLLKYGAIFLEPCGLPSVAAQIRRHLLGTLWPTTTSCYGRPDVPEEAPSVGHRGSKDLVYTSV